MSMPTLNDNDSAKGDLSHPEPGSDPESNSLDKMIRDLKNLRARQDVSVSGAHVGSSRPELCQSIPAPTASALFIQSLKRDKTPQLPVPPTPPKFATKLKKEHLLAVRHSLERCASLAEGIFFPHDSGELTIPLILRPKSKQAPSIEQVQVPGKKPLGSSKRKYPNPIFTKKPAKGERSQLRTNSASPLAKPKPNLNTKEEKLPKPSSTFPSPLTKPKPTLDTKEEKLPEPSSTFPSPLTNPKPTLNTKETKLPMTNSLLPKPKPTLNTKQEKLLTTDSPSLKGTSTEVLGQTPIAKQLKSSTPRPNRKTNPLPLTTRPTSSEEDFDRSIQEEDYNDVFTSKTMRQMTYNGPWVPNNKSKSFGRVELTKPLVTVSHQDIFRSTIRDETIPLAKVPLAPKTLSAREVDKIYGPVNDLIKHMKSSPSSISPAKNRSPLRPTQRTKMATGNKRRRLEFSNK